MSGIEIAGLVLGAIPLVTSAIEHYCDSMATLGRLRDYETDLKYVANTLYIEQTKLKNTCERLLIGVVPRRKIEAMLDEPLGPLWKDDAVHKKIRARLWTSYDAFGRTIDDIHTYMHSLLDRLGLNDDGTIKSPDGSVLRRKLQRAGFVLKKQTFDELVNRIKDRISSLEALTQSSVVLEPERMKRVQGGVLKVVRTTSNSLYRALKDSLAGRDMHLSQCLADFASIDGHDMLAGQPRLVWYTYEYVLAGESRDLVLRAAVKVAALDLFDAGVAGDIDLCRASTTHAESNRLSLRP